MSISFLYSTIPFMKAMERMTNPCFQDKNFAKVMKGKHVEQDPDEFCAELKSSETYQNMQEKHKGSEQKGYYTIYNLQRKRKGTGMLLIISTLHQW